MCGTNRISEINLDFHGKIPKFFKNLRSIIEIWRNRGWTKFASFGDFRSVCLAPFKILALPQKLRGRARLIDETASEAVDGASERAPEIVVSDASTH